MPQQIDADAIAEAEYEAMDRKVAELESEAELYLRVMQRCDQCLHCGDSEYCNCYCAIATA